MCGRTADTIGRVAGRNADTIGGFVWGGAAVNPKHL